MLGLAGSRCTAQTNICRLLYRWSHQHNSMVQVLQPRKVIRTFRPKLNERSLVLVSEKERNCSETLGTHMHVLVYEATHVEERDTGRSSMGRCAANTVSATTDAT